jgi:hypothetical protein
MIFAASLTFLATSSAFILSSRSTLDDNIHYFI